MGTLFTDIYNLSMITIRDYKIDKLATVDMESFKTYFRGLLIKAIPEFNGCLQSLDYTSQVVGTETVYSFVSDLTATEQGILSDFAIIKWFDTKVQDVTQFQLHLSQRDFDIKSEQANLKAKSEYVDKLREKVRLAMSEYQAKDLISLATFYGVL